MLSVKDSELAKSTNTIRGDLTFSEVSSKSLGSAMSILFWNHLQKKLINSIKSAEHTILMGDYGTGEIKS